MTNTIAPGSGMLYRPVKAVIRYVGIRLEQVKMFNGEKCTLADRGLDLSELHFVISIKI